MNAAQAAIDWCDNPYKQVCVRMLLQAIDKKPARGLAGTDIAQGATKRRASLMVSLRRASLAEPNQLLPSFLSPASLAGSFATHDVSPLAEAPATASHWTPVRTAVAEHNLEMASMPMPLSLFTPLCNEATVKAALGELPPLENAVVKVPHSATARQALDAGVSRARSVLEGVPDLSMRDLQCYAVLCYDI